jgi:NADH dehydrogenase [ubiquinone] 1 alpha subcomplex assembly factor 5
MIGDHEIIDRRLLLMRRNRAAQTASAHDFLLARVGDDFAERLSLVRRPFPVVLNLGAHHGLLGRRLRQLPGQRLVIDADHCARLASQCDGPCVLADDELLPFAPASFDLVVSGLALQFVNDLPGTLVQIRHALKPDGLLLAALLGGRTLVELRQAFLAAEEQVEGGASPRVIPFADVQDLGSLLQRAEFAMPVVDGDVATVSYQDPLALMHDLRAMGATNPLRARRRMPLRRATLARALEIYSDQFTRSDGRVVATFEILTLTAWAPDTNQPKPLRPGSAHRRLADALGTTEMAAGDKAIPKKPGSDR